MDGWMQKRGSLGRFTGCKRPKEREGGRRRGEGKEGRKMRKISVFCVRAVRGGGGRGKTERQRGEGGRWGGEVQVFFGGVFLF